MDGKGDPVHSKEWCSLVIHLYDADEKAQVRRLKIMQDLWPLGPTSFWGTRASGVEGGASVTLESSLMMSGVSSMESKLGTRTRLLSSATSWSSGSTDVRFCNSA